MDFVRHKKAYIEVHLFVCVCLWSFHVCRGLFWAMDFARHEQAFIEDVLLWISSMSIFYRSLLCILLFWAHGFCTSRTGLYWGRAFMGIIYGYVWDCDSFIFDTTRTWIWRGMQRQFFLICYFGQIDLARYKTACVFDLNESRTDMNYLRTHTYMSECVLPWYEKPRFYMH